MTRVSVIVPAHQEEEMISSTLRSCTAQVYDDFEVIVVANGCTDRTAEIAGKFGCCLDLLVVETEQTGIGYACNVGAARSDGDIICILEADTELHYNALDRIVESVGEGYVGGTVRMRPKEDGLVYRLMTDGCALLGGLDWGPVRFCTRDVYEAIGGHRENADFGVDSDFADKVRAQGPTVYIQDACHWTSFRRFEKLGLREFMRQTAAYLTSKMGLSLFGTDHKVIR